MIPGFSRRQKSETMSFAVTSISKKNSVFVVRRLEILNIQRRFALSRFLRWNHFFVVAVAVAGQIPSTTSTGFRFTACLEQAISRNFNGGRYNTNRISKGIDHGAIVLPTSFKLCRMVLTYTVGMEQQGLM